MTTTVWKHKTNTKWNSYKSENSVTKFQRSSASDETALEQQYSRCGEWKAKFTKQKKAVDYLVSLSVADWVSE